jgi:hypothetical protein
MMFILHLIKYDTFTEMNNHLNCKNHTDELVSMLSEACYAVTHQTH